MKKIAKVIMTVLAAGSLVCGTPAQAGAASEGLKYIAKVLRTAGSAARSAIDDAAQLSPAIRNLVNRYGDNAVASLASNPRRVQLVETLGDDAAEALLKHQNIAEKTLHLCPDAEVASALKKMDRASGQYLAMCSGKHDLSPDDLKNVVLIVREGGEKAAASLSRLTPEKLEKVLYTAQVAGIAAAATMVVSTAADCSSLSEFGTGILEQLSWLWEHPVAALLLFALLLISIIRFPEIAARCLQWIPRLCWSALKALWFSLCWLLKRFCHRARAYQAAKKQSQEG